MQFRLKPRILVILLPIDGILTGNQLQLIVGLGVMPMKRYPTFPKSPELDPDVQMQFSVKLWTLVLFDL